jgi:hypothetical protein
MLQNASILVTMQEKNQTNSNVPILKNSIGNLEALPYLAIVLDAPISNKMKNKNETEEGFCET